MESLQSENGTNSSYFGHSGSHGDPQTASGSVVDDEKIHSGRKRLPKISGPAKTGSPFLPGKNTISLGSLPPASTSNHLKLVGKKVGSDKGPRAAARDVATSRKALAPPSPTKVAEAQYNDQSRPLKLDTSPVYHDGRPTTRSSKAPHTSADQPESSRKAQQRGDVIEVHDDEDEDKAQPPSLADLFADLAPTRSHDRKGKGRAPPPPFNDGPRVRPKPGSRSRSPKKSTFAANPAPQGSREKSLDEEYEHVERERPDPIQDPEASDWDDEPEFVRDSGPTGRRPIKAGLKGSRTPSKSPEKPPAARRTSGSWIGSGMIAPHRQQPNIRSSGIGPPRHPVPLRGGYCIYQDSHRRDCFITDTLALDRDISLHRQEAGSDGDIRIPLDAISALKVCRDADQPCMLMEVEMKAGACKDARRRLAAIMTPVVIKDPVDSEDLRTFKMFLSLRSDNDSTRLLQDISRWFDEGPRKVANLTFNERKTHSDFLSQLQKRLREEARSTSAPAAEPVPIDPHRGLGVNKAARQAKLGAEPAMSIRDKTMPDAKGKGKQKDNADQQKLSFSRSPAPRPVSSRQPPSGETRRSSGRLNNRATTLTILSDHEDAKPAPRKSSALTAPLDKETVLFPYPLTGRSLLTITKGDRWRVESGEFLNDTLVEWGLRNMFADLGKDGPDSDVHLFNSFFYNKIGASHLRNAVDSESNVWLPYATVRKWTKTTDIFSKKFIVVPINEEYHWYLAIVYNPGALLRAASAKKDDPKETSDEAREPGDRPESSEGEDEDDVEKGLEMDIRIDSISGSTEGDNTTTPRAESPDPIDCFVADPPAGENTEQISQGMKDMEVSSSRSSPTKRSSPIKCAERSGQEIDPGVLAGFSRAPNERESSNGILASKGKNAEMADKYADHDIVSSDRTWIFTFDSLGAQHKAVATTLGRWLKSEAKDKKGVDIDHKLVQYTHAQVPLQTNFSDCGLYLVHYATQMLKRPDEILRFIERRLPHKNSDVRKAFEQDVVKTWGISRDHNLRQEWHGTIESLIDEYAKVKEADADDKRSKDSSSSPVKPADIPLAATKRMSPEKVASSQVATSIEPLATQLPDHPVERIEAEPTVEAEVPTPSVPISVETTETPPNGRQTTSTSPQQGPPTEQGTRQAGSTKAISVSPSADGEEDHSNPNSEVTDSRQAASPEKSPSGPPTGNIPRDIHTAFVDIIESHPPDHTEVSSEKSSPVLPPHTRTPPPSVQVRPISEERDELEDDDDEDIEPNPLRPRSPRVATPLPGHIAPSTNLNNDDSMTDIDYNIMSQELESPPLTHEVSHVSAVSSSGHISSPMTSAPTSAVVLFPVVQKSTPVPVPNHPRAKGGPVGKPAPWQSLWPTAGAQAVTDPVISKSANPKMTEPRRPRNIPDGTLVSQNHKNSQLLVLNQDPTPIDIDDDSDTDQEESSIPSGHKRRQSSRIPSFNKATSSTPRKSTEERLSDGEQSSEMSLRSPGHGTGRRGSNRTTYQDSKRRKKAHIDISSPRQTTRGFQLSSPLNQRPGEGSNPTPARQSELTPISRHYTSTPGARGNPPSSDRGEGGSSSLHSPRDHDTPRVEDGFVAPFLRDKRRQNASSDVLDSPSSKKPRSGERSKGSGQTRNDAIDVQSDNDS